jgi:hypothetical protein
MNIIAHITVMKSHVLSFTVQMMTLLVVAMIGIVAVKIVIIVFFN